jgi:hypothetical protein
VRYALRVGEIDVLVISDGVLPISAPTLATNADPADLAAWLDDMFLPQDVLEWPLNVVVVNIVGNREDQMSPQAVGMRRNRQNSPRLREIREPSTQCVYGAAILGIHVYDQRSARAVDHLRVSLEHVRVPLRIRHRPATAPAANPLRRSPTRHNHAIPV